VPHEDFTTYARAALRADQAFVAAPLDLPLVLSRGRRLRLYRRLGYAGAGAAVVAATALAALPLLHATPPAPALSSVSPSVHAVGAVVSTGLMSDGSERVYFFSSIHEPSLPRVTIGLNAGLRSPDGTLTGDLLVNDVQGSDRSPGFHQIGYDQGSGKAIPTFGYFVGPAATIQARTGPEELLAHVAGWSVDPNVKIFWFDPAALPPGLLLDGILAFDSHGRRL
jgi:hypothetical protein